MTDIAELKQRVHQFNMLELPGQPQFMHMGTSYLVSDLLRALEAQAKRIEALEDECIDLDGLKDKHAARIAELEGRVRYLNYLMGPNATYEAGFAKATELAAEEVAHSLGHTLGPAGIETLLAALKELPKKMKADG